MSVEFDRVSPGKFDSRTLNRNILNRWTGRTKDSLCLFDWDPNIVFYQGGLSLTGSFPNRATQHSAQETGQAFATRSRFGVLDFGVFASE